MDRNQMMTVLLFYSQDELVLTYSSQPFIELWATHSGALCNLESHQMLKGSRSADEQGCKLQCLPCILGSSSVSYSISLPCHFFSQRQVPVFQIDWAQGN